MCSGVKSFSINRYKYYFTFYISELYICLYFSLWSKNYILQECENDNSLFIMTSRLFLPQVLISNIFNKWHNYFDICKSYFTFV